VGSHVDCWASAKLPDLRLRETDVIDRLRGQVVYQGRKVFDAPDAVL
jgi:hypothetical protein